MDEVDWEECKRRGRKSIIDSFRSQRPCLIQWGKIDPKKGRCSKNYMENKHAERIWILETIWIAETRWFVSFCSIVQDHTIPSRTESWHDAG